MFRTRNWAAVGIFGLIVSGPALSDDFRDVSITTSEGFADIDIPISNFAQVDDGGWHIEVRGRLRTVSVGFDVRLDPGWESQEIGEDNSPFVVLWGSAVILASGPESNNFCDLLQRSYDIDFDSRHMPDSLPLIAVSLDSDPAELESEPLKSKMFIEHEREDYYAEFFLNVDLNRMMLEFHEKDLEYRTNVIRAFCSSGA